MDTHESFKLKIIREGSGPGYCTHVVEKGGFKVTAIVSKDEKFLGVNFAGTDNSWDNHTISWSIKGYMKDYTSPFAYYINYEKIQPTVEYMKSLGSIGCFYEADEDDKKELIDYHSLVLEIAVYTQWGGKEPVIEKDEENCA
jgi:hypothetical protein